MILTGKKIASELEAGHITISDFSLDRLNPNSYNYRLGQELKVFAGVSELGEPLFEDELIPESGYLLKPGMTYLGVTEEIIGSSKYAMSLIGRSSMGRYGLFLQISANLGHTTSCHRWTLELMACKPIILYPSMNVGQVSFWNNTGPIECFGKRYANFNAPTETFK